MDERPSAPVRLFRAALRLLPGWWRERYGAEVVEVFVRRLEAAREEGPWPAAVRTLREVQGLVAAAGRLRLAAARRVIREGGVGTLAQDARFALRSLVRNPGFSLTAVAVLSVGIGATSAIFSAVDAVLLKPLPFAEPDRLVALWEHNPEKDWWENSSAPANVLDWREGVDAFEDVGFHAFGTTPATWIADGEPVELRGMSVSGNFFDVLGVSPALGRDFRWEETWATDGDDGVLLAHDAWVGRFGSDPSVVGRRIELDGRSVEVVGVMPAGIRFPDDEVDFWTPFGWDPAYRDQTWFRRAHWVWPVARLAAGVTPEEADERLQGVVARLQEAYPETNRAMGAHVTPLHDFLVGDADTPLWILLGAVGLLLLVTCANVGNLQLLRAAGRSRELAVRRALGAGGGRLAGQILAESVLLGLAAGAAGLALGWVGVRVLSGLRPVGLDGVGGITLDARVVAFTFAVALLSGLLFGLLPALRGARGDVARDLREGRRSGDGRRSRRVVGGLVVAEVALALVLVAGAGLLGRSFHRLASQDPGFRTEDVLTFRLSLPGAAYESRDAVLGFYERLERAAEALPSVRAVALADIVPLAETGWTSDFSVEGWPPDRAGFEVHHRTVSPDYFALMDVPLLEGRLPRPGEGMDGAERVVLVNQTFARQTFPDGRVLGRRIANDREPTEESVWRTVVGVVGDERVEGLRTPARPEMFEPVGQDWDRDYRVVVRTVGEPMGALPGLRGVVGELDPRLPLSSVLTMEDIHGDALARERFLLTLLAAFGAVALLLAAVGVYGVTARATRRRTREIGVRVALGAEPGSVRRMVLLQGIRLTALGIGLGTAAALATGRVLESVLYEVEPTDPVTLVGVAVLLGGVAVAASWIPALRATRVHPAEALRSE